MQANLGHLKAAAQLAEMAYNADNSDFKKAAWEKAKSEYDTAWKAEQDSQELMEDAGELATRWIGEISRLEEANRQLELMKHSLESELSFLKNQLIEKTGKIADLEKLLLSAKSTTPAPTPAKPLTGAAKVAAEKKAAEAAAAEAEKLAAEVAAAEATAQKPAATPEPTDEAKKNS